MRSEATQFCPQLMKQPLIAACTACSSVGVVADDERVLAAELHHHRRHALGARLHDAPSVADRADEQDHVDGGARQRGAGLAEALHGLDEVGIVTRVLHHRRAAHR